MTTPTEFVEQQGPALLRYIERSLPARLRRHCEADDIRNSIWAAVLAKGVLDHLSQTPHQAAAYLRRAAANYILWFCRKHFGTSNRKPSRERSLDERPELEGLADPKMPSPLEAAQARESWERLLASLSARDRRIVVLRGQGHTYPEIALHVGVSVMTVRRVLGALALHPPEE